MARPMSEKLAEGDMSNSHTQSLDFAWSVRAMRPLAKRLGLTMPGYRGVKGSDLEVQQRGDGGWTVTVDYDQPGHRLVLDMLDGLIAANEREAAFQVDQEARRDFESRQPL